MLSQEQREAVAEAVSLCDRLRVAYNVYGGVELATVGAFLRSILDGERANVTSEADRVLNYLAAAHFALDQTSHWLAAAEESEIAVPKQLQNTVKDALVLPPDLEATVERRILQRTSGVADAR